MAELLSPDGRRALVRVARASIGEALTRDGSLARALEAAETFPALGARRANFVTLKTVSSSGARRLRGCIGTLRGDAPLARGVARNARDAAFRDPRFKPLTPSEWPDISVSVSVLTEPEAVTGAEAIVAGRDGVILTLGGRRAVFLPEVAVEQGWDRETLLAELARKAGLPPEAWREASLEVFRSEAFGEETPGGPLREQDR